MRITLRISRIVTGIAVCMLLASAGILPAGSPDSPGTPGVTSSYTLEDIYNRLSSGTAGSPGTFTEPAAGPTSGTMHTLNDIVDKAPLADDANGASAGEVLQGKTFWAVTSNGWGPRTGTLATQTVSDATVSQPAGIYSVFNLSAVDTDLAAGNIKSGATIFGVSGKSTVVDTAGGTAAAGDVLSGKTAYVNGNRVTGSVAAGENVTGANGSKTITIPNGLYSGSTTATAGDTNLVAGNIKSGVSIFGTAGNVVQATGDANPSDVYPGMTFSNSSSSGLTGTMVNNGKGRTITPGTANQIVAAGYWEIYNTVKGDTKLVADNIKSGVSIFGVTGNLVGGISSACLGSSSPKGRWCDNGDGTVTDTSTGLVWLQKADWGALSIWSDAFTRSALCAQTDTSTGLSDGSIYGDWRLPTADELWCVFVCGYETVDMNSMYKFTGLQEGCYWTGTMDGYYNGIREAIAIGLEANPYSVNLRGYDPSSKFRVWPVRNAQ